MRYAGETPPFRGSDGESLPGSIAEAAYLRLGGIDQWVLIRGARAENPPLVFLHGGPGLSELGLFRSFNAPLERHFTVVHWDQRGAGRSYTAGIPRSSMTVAQLLSDLDELVDAVRRRLGRQRVALFGHSWGSALGVLYAARFPEKVAAYVGSGQIGDWPAGERSSYAYALAEAERQGDRRGLRALRLIGPPPHSAEKLWVQRWQLSRLERGLSPWTLLRTLRILLGVPESSLLELPRLYRGFRFSIDAMWAEVSALNLHTLAPALQVPVFFFLGRRDHWVPVEHSVAYFDALTAPAKRLVLFDASGHEPFVDEPARFNAAMVELVRPVAGIDQEVP